MPETLYLDNSVLNAFFDKRKPERQAITQRFWRETLPSLDAYVSELTLVELRRTPNPARRQELLKLATDCSVLSVRPNAHQLARTFLEAELVPEEEPEDALHLAIAVVEGVDFLVSWNFEHMVNVRTKRLLPMLAAKQGYFRQLLIVSPQEFWRSSRGTS